MTQAELTRGFAEAIMRWPVEEDRVIELARWLMIDGLAVAVVGLDEPGPTKIAELAREEDSAPVATLIGRGFKSSLVNAARVNGVAMHVMDFEPMWSPPSHMTSTTLPGLLALAEKLEAERGQAMGLALIKALARGVEAHGRLRVASGQYEPGGLRFHPPGVVGPISSAAACASFLGLDIDRTVMAMGIAASRCSAIIGNIGSMTKALHCGDATAHGLEAALLAEKGFTADRDALAGRRGYGFAYYGDSFDPSKLADPVVAPRLVSPGLAWKLFPSQYATHFAITAALDCRRDIADPSMIERIEVTTPDMAYVDRPRPATGLAGKFSFQYAVATALLDATVGLESFSDSRRYAPDMEAMLDRVTLRRDPAINGTLDGMHVVVRVTLKDGTVVERTCTAPEGSWSRPVGLDRVEKKARGLLEARLDARRYDAFWRQALAQPAKISIRELMAAVG